MAAGRHSGGATATTAEPQTMGGRRRAPAQMGDEHYLWVLVVLEVLALFALRAGFKRSHGG